MSSWVSPEMWAAAVSEMEQRIGLQIAGLEARMEEIQETERESLPVQFGERITRLEEAEAKTEIQVAAAIQSVEDLMAKVGIISKDMGTGQENITSRFDAVAAQLQDLQFKMLAGRLEPPKEEPAVDTDDIGTDSKAGVAPNVLPFGAGLKESKGADAFHEDDPWANKTPQRGAGAGPEREDFEMKKNVADRMGFDRKVSKFSNEKGAQEFKDWAFEIRRVTKNDPN